MFWLLRWIYMYKNTELSHFCHLDNGKQSDGRTETMESNIFLPANQNEISTCSLWCLYSKLTVVLQEKSSEGRKFIEIFSLKKRSNINPRVSPPGYKVDYLAGQLTVFFLRSQGRWWCLLLEASASEVELGAYYQGKEKCFRFINMLDSRLRSLALYMYPG